MEGEVKEKLEVPKRQSSVTITLPGIPRSVHNKMLKYRRTLNRDRQKDYNLKAAYVEFLKEATKSIK